MWKGKKKIWAGLWAACVLLLAGCGQAETEQQQGDSFED